MAKSRFVSGDPVGSDTQRRGKSAKRRLGRYDAPVGAPGTGERFMKEKLMRQFLKYDGFHGNSEAYVSASCWDKNGKLKP